MIRYRYLVDMPLGLWEADAMAADWAWLLYDVPGRISNRVVFETLGISRVVYDITSRSPSAVKWE